MGLREVLVRVGIVFLMVFLIAGAALADNHDDVLVVSIRADFEDPPFSEVVVSIHERLPGGHLGAMVLQTRPLAVDDMRSEDGAAQLLAHEGLDHADYLVNVKAFNPGGSLYSDQTRRVNFRDNTGLLFPLDTLGDARLAVDVLIDRDGDGRASLGDLAKVTARVRNFSRTELTYRDDFLGANLVLCRGTVHTQVGEIIRGNGVVDSMVEVQLPGDMTRGWYEISYNAVFAPTATAHGQLQRAGVSGIIAALPTNDQRTIAPQDQTRTILNLDRETACATAVAVDPKLQEKLRLPLQPNIRLRSVPERKRD